MNLVSRKASRIIIAGIDEENSLLAQMHVIEGICITTVGLGVLYAITSVVAFGFIFAAAILFEPYPSISLSVIIPDAFDKDLIAGAFKSNA